MTNRQNQGITREQKLVLARKYATRLGMLDARPTAPTEASVEIAKAFLLGGATALVAATAPRSPGPDYDAEEAASALYEELWELAGELVVAQRDAKDVFGNALRTNDEVAVPLAFANVDDSADAELATARIQTIFMEKTEGGSPRVKAFVSFTDSRGDQAPAPHEVYLDETALKALPRAGRGQVTPQGVPVPGKPPAPTQ